MGVHLERRRIDDRMQLERGVIALNEPANPPERGMLVLVVLPRIDVEAWADWLGIGVEPTASRAPRRPKATTCASIYIALRTPELILSNRSFRNVTLGATRTDAGGYDVNVVSDGASRVTSAGARVRKAAAAARASDSFRRDCRGSTSPAAGRPKSSMCCGRRRAAFLPSRSPSRISNSVT